MHKIASTVSLNGVLNIFTVFTKWIEIMSKLLLIFGKLYCAVICTELGLQRIFNALQSYGFPCQYEISQQGRQISEQITQQLWAPHTGRMVRETQQPIKQRDQPKM